jgi:TPP-dependent pyruvate/acetoin dehydrogenase alpha subunit
MHYKNFGKRPFNLRDIKIRKAIFNKICKIRFFELEVQKNKELNNIKNLIYLSLGQEAVYAAISEAIKRPNIFFQHRGHGPYLAFDGNAEKLRDELLGLKTGCNKGMGGSPCIFDRSKKIFGHVGLIGDQVPVAAGYCFVKKETTVCFFGDGAAEEDYVLATLGMAATKKLKIIFVCDDNDYSVLTKTKIRRSWNLADVAKSFKLTSLDVVDDPVTIYHAIKKLKRKLPALINIRTCREFWHEGSGKDNPNKSDWNRFEIEKNFFSKFDNIFLNKCIKSNQLWAKKLWQKI